MTPRGSLAGAAMVVGAATTWGTWSLFLRPTGLPSTVTAPFVLLGVFLFSFPFFRADGVTPRWDRETLGLLALYAALDAVNIGAFFGAMDVTSVAVAVLTHSVAPVLVALLAPTVASRFGPPGASRPTRRALPAALLAFGGLALLLRPWEPGAREGAVALGAALGLTSALAYASLVFLVDRLAARIGPARTMGWHALPAALLLAPLAAGDLAAVEPRDVAILTVGALGPGVVAGVAFVHGLTRIGPARAAVLAFLEPLVACVVGWLAFGEALPPVALLGGALVLGAGVLVTLPAPEPTPGVAR